MIKLFSAIGITLCGIVNSADCLQLFLYCAELWEIPKKLLGPQLHAGKIYLHCKPYFRLDLDYQSVLSGIG